MDRRRQRKHRAHKRVLVVCDEHRPFFEATPGGTKSVAKLDRAVAAEAARFTDQEQHRIKRQRASERCQNARDTLFDGLRHVAKVGTLVTLDDGVAGALEVPHTASDESLLARAEAIHAAASAHAELFVSEGVQPGLLDALSREVAAFRKAKDALTLAGKQFTEATEALDDALAEGNEAIAVLQGILKTSADAPVGALTAFVQAKRIGPRKEEDGEAGGPTPVAPAA